MLLWPPLVLLLVMLLPPPGDATTTPGGGAAIPGVDFIYSWRQTLVPGVGLMTCTIGLLFFFACLMTMGELYNNCLPTCLHTPVSLPACLSARQYLLPSTWYI